MTRAPRVLAIPLVVLGLSACSKNQLLDVAMASVPHIPPPTRHVGPYELLAGDLHCHLQPPDAEHHVSRELLDTVRLATQEGLDFVLLTPHVPARFFLDPEMREWVRGTQSVLRARVEAIDSRVILIPGMEYTDHRFGHVGLGFADVAEVLEEVSIEDLNDHPSHFFERWSAHGGMAFINHPTAGPLTEAPIMQLRYNYAWRDFDPTMRVPEVFPEIRWLSEHAQGIETLNISMSHLRDQFFMPDPDWSIRQSAHLLDREARSQHRRIAPVGGSDSHGMWIRPATWVLATERSARGVRDAIAAGRTCVRGPEGCTLEVRGADGAFHVVGASIATAPPRSQSTVEARAFGGPVTYVVNGAIAATGSDGELVNVPVPGRCALVRVRVADSWSGPVYVDCPWAK